MTVERNRAHLERADSELEPAPQHSGGSSTAPVPPTTTLATMCWQQCSEVRRCRSEPLEVSIETLEFPLEHVEHFVESPPAILHAICPFVPMVSPCYNDRCRLL